MSVVCVEGEDHFMSITDEAFCVTTPEADIYSAVCQQHLNAIPAEERSKEHIMDGLDVHYLHSTPNALPGREGNLSLRNMQFGDFKFSLSAETAMQYLPHSARKYLAG